MNAHLRAQPCKVCASWLSWGEVDCKAGHSRPDEGDQVSRRNPRFSRQSPAV